MNSYKSYIDKRKEKYIGCKVLFGNKQYTVVDVDYNGMLLIDRKTQFNDTTAIDLTSSEVEVIYNDN